MPTGINYNPYSAGTVGGLQEPLYGPSSRGRSGETNQQRRLAEILLRQGTDTSPVQSPWQGVARVGNALAAALLNYRADRADTEQQQGIANTTEQAIRAGKTEWTAPVGGDTRPPAMPSDMGPHQFGAGPLPPGAQMLAPGETVPIPGATGGVGAMARVLAQNPDTAQMGLRLALGSAVSDQERTANAAADEKRQRLAAALRGPNLQSGFDDSGNETRFMWDPDKGQLVGVGGSKRERPQVPHVQSFIDDETGQLSTKQWNPATGQWDRIGGAKQGAGSGAGGLSIAQQRLNDETDQARLTLDQLGMSREDLLRKSQPTSATGRPNPDYDPRIGQLVTRATRRRYGADPDHSRYLGGVHGVTPQGGSADAPQGAASPAATGFNPGGPYGPTGGTSADPKANRAPGGLQNLPQGGAFGELPYLPNGQLDMRQVRPDVTYTHPQHGKVRLNPATGMFEGVN